MSKLFICLAAASALGFAGAASAQTAPQQPVNPSPAQQPQQPMSPSAAPEAPQAPAGSTAPAPAAPAAAPLAAGMPVKDNKGVTIGQISELKPDATGAQQATIKMGSDSFTVAAAALAVQSGAAVINLTQAELQAQVHKPKT